MLACKFKQINQFQHEAVYHPTPTNEHYIACNIYTYYCCNSAH